MSLPYRQVHLDFHTSECIEGIGSRFSRENFRAALIAGHINSITLFSKGHHGWSYHPTQVNLPHPHLCCDLLDEQLARYDIRAIINVMRDSQKGIIIGKAGSMLKKIGQSAREEIEKLDDKKVYLDLQVKIQKDWRKHAKSLKNFGYSE